MVDSLDPRPSDWRILFGSISLPDGGVHIWRLHLDKPQRAIDRMSTLLAGDEPARAGRFVKPLHRRRFAVAHAGLRLVLAKYLPVHPKQIQFQTNPHGKPRLVQNGEIAFNLSHSADLALIAVTSHPAIGVDLERYRPRLEAEKIAKRHFSESEVEILFDLPEDQREGAFYACWTRKEAYIKARGEGLALGLKRFDVAFAPGLRPGLLKSDEGEAELKRWSFINLAPAPRCAAACVVEGQVSELCCWDADALEPDR